MRVNLVKKKFERVILSTYRRRICVRIEVCNFDRIYLYYCCKKKNSK